MGRIRDSDRTRARIIEAAAAEFSEKGYDAATVSEVARRAALSKQLVHHHFRTKEALFREVHDRKFRPTVEWQEMLPDDVGDLIAERFLKRAQDAHYIRFLTWEAASGRASMPGRAARQRRIAEYGGAVRKLQAAGKLPAEVDHRLIQLAILALATYPMAYAQITRLVTGRAATDGDFQKEWYAFLQWAGRRLFRTSGRPRTAKDGARERRAASPAGARPTQRKTTRVVSRRS